MSSSNYLQEIKKEYTIQLINMLTPPVYEGINSIYSEVKSIALPGEELKVLFINSLKIFDVPNVKFELFSIIILDANLV